MGNNIDRPNIASDDKKKSFIERIEAKLREKESEKGSFMKRCATINEEIKSILDEAKGAGLPKASMKGVIKARELEAKARKVREELEADDLAIFVSIREALGDYADLPLGAAALARDEAQQDPTTAAIVQAVQADEAREAAKSDSPAEPAGEGEKPDFTADRARDDAAFADMDKKADAQGEEAEPAALDAKSARKNRTTRAAPPSAAADVEAGHVRF